MGGSQTVGLGGHSHEQWEATSRDDTVPPHILQRWLRLSWAKCVTEASVATGEPVRSFQSLGPEVTEARMRQG